MDAGQDFDKRLIMPSLIWISEEDDEAIDLGDPFALSQAFTEMERAAESDDGWEELLSVPQFVDAEDADPDWLAAVRDQAAWMLDKHGDGLSEHTRWVLGQLGEGGEEEGGDEDESAPDET
jgi:hypothetical protein